MQPVESLDRNHQRSGFMQQLRRDRTGVAEALHHDRRSLERKLQVLAGRLDGVEHAAPGGFIASQRSAQADRLARDYAGIRSSPW